MLILKSMLDGRMFRRQVERLRSRKVDSAAETITAGSLC